MVRRKQRREVPIFLDIDNSWVILFHGLWVGVPAATLMVLAFGTAPLTIALAATLFVVCVGMGFLIRAIGRSLDS